MGSPSLAASSLTWSKGRPIAWATPKSIKARRAYSPLLESFTTWDLKSQVSRTQLVVSKYNPLAKELSSQASLSRSRFTSRPAQSVTAVVQFNIRHHQMVAASQTKVAHFAVVICEGSIALTTVAMADHMVIDSLNHGVHWRRTCHCPEFTANRVLLFFSGCLRC